MRQLEVTLNLPDFEYLASDGVQKDLEYRTILSGSRTLQENIRQSLINNIPKATNRNPKYIDTMADAVQITKATSDGERAVHGLGSGKTGSGTYRARFFENTTQKRYQKTYKGKKLKKKRYVGVITGTSWFSKGVSQGTPNMQNSMFRYAQNYIQNKIRESMK